MCKPTTELIDGTNQSNRGHCQGSVIGNGTTPGEQTSATVPSRSSYLRRRLTPPEFHIDPHTVQVIWRDFLFLVLGCLALSIVRYVETHASDPEARVSVSIAGIVSTRQIPMNPNGIVDTGYILTQPLYEWLKEHRHWNDVFAAVNSLVLVVPSVYIAYVTAWKGDYSLVFRLIAVQLLRAFCGWFTYLPPDPTYLNSSFDFPDIIHCLVQECAGKTPQVIPFVSFFSGHVATMAITGNHMWLSKHIKMASLIHFLNGLQIIRLLATRGHYSIDMIIAWHVAVYVSNPAGRLGRYYSKGAKVHEILPKTPTEAFEHISGVADARNESRMSALLKREDVQEVLLAMQNDPELYEDYQSETTARILQETTVKLLHERAQMVQERMHYLQQQGQEHILYMKKQGEEHMAYMKEQAQAVVTRHRNGSSDSSIGGSRSTLVSINTKKTKEL